MATTVQTRAGGGTVRRWERPVRLTALHREHVAAGAELVERDGWLLPRSYGSTAPEQAAIREAVGLLDIGANGKIDIKSDNLEGVLQVLHRGDTEARSGRGDAAQLPVLCVSVLNDNLSVYRLADDEALVLTTPDQLQATLDALAQAATVQSCTHVTDLTGALAGLRLLGPTAPAVLERLTSLDLAPDRFAEGTLAQGAIARVQALVARRDTAGVPGYDIYVDRDLAAYVWDAFMEQGAPLRIRPVGYDSDVAK